MSSSHIDLELFSGRWHGSIWPHTAAAAKLDNFWSSFVPLLLHFQVELDSKFRWVDADPSKYSEFFIQLQIVWATIFLTCLLIWWMSPSCMERTSEEKWSLPAGTSVDTVREREEESRKPEPAEQEDQSEESTWSHCSGNKRQKQNQHKALQWITNTLLLKMA